MKLKPLGDKVVVEVLESEDKSAGGILLPDTAQKKPQEGIVVAVGPGKLLESGSRAEMSVKAKDRVIFSKYGGTEVTIDGKELVILDEDQIFAIHG
jgi:chaperonin GroES